MSLGPAHRPAAFRNTLRRTFRRAAMDLAPSMLLSDSKNVLLRLPMGQGLDVWPSKKALMTRNPPRWSRKEAVPCSHESRACLTSPRLHHRGRCHVWPCASVPFYDAQPTHVTPQGGADKSLSSVLSLAPDEICLGCLVKALGCKNWMMLPLRVGSPFLSRMWQK